MLKSSTVTSLTLCYVVANKNNFTEVYEDSTSTDLQELKMHFCQIDSDVFAQILRYPAALTKLDLVYNDLNLLDPEIAWDRPSHTMTIAYWIAMKAHANTLRHIRLLTPWQECWYPRPADFPQLRTLDTWSYMMSSWPNVATPRILEECGPKIPPWIDMVILRRQSMVMDLS